MAASTPVGDESDDLKVVEFAKAGMVMASAMAREVGAATGAAAGALRDPGMPVSTPVCFPRAHAARTIGARCG